MRPSSRQPSRLPVRGTLGLVGTIGALALLLSFRGARTQDSTLAVAADDDAPASIESTAGRATADVPGSSTELVAPITLTGDRIDTRWGTVQVAVTIAGDDVVAVEALSLPDGDRRSAGISEYVEELLGEEAVDLDSADVSVISGATYTSRAYATSLQSALDQAGS